MSEETSSNQTAEQEPHQSQRRYLGWKSCVALLIFIIVFYSLITPNVGSGPAHPRTLSLNNLHNFGLAQKNHAKEHDALFAAPTLYNEDGLPVHGWMIQLLPYLDNPSLDNAFDLSIPWNHPDNQELSRGQLRIALNPGLDEKINADGYPLLHYTLNPRLFPNHESLTQEELSNADGLANTILMGEIQEGLPAWAEPGSARDPARGLRPGPNTMGVSIWGGKTVLGFADGRAMAINNDIDPDVLNALSTPDGDEEISDW